MNWKKIEEEDIYTCNTPIGKYEIVGGYGYNSYFGNETISRGTDLETAKEDARTHLYKTYYMLKLFLEV